MLSLWMLIAGGAWRMTFNS